MGAYENPAQIVDTKSGQMIGAALASVGQSIGKGIEAKSKAESKAFAQYEKVKQQNFKIDTSVDINLSKQQNAMYQNLEKEGYVGVELDTMKDSADAKFKQYGDALKRTSKATGDYEGYKDDINLIQKFDNFIVKNQDVFGSIAAFDEDYNENIKTGKLSSDTNPEMKIFNGVSNKALKGNVTWAINDNFEWEATVNSENIKDLNRTRSGYLKQPFDGEPGEEMREFKGSYTFNMNRVAEAYNTSENPFNNAFMSTKADVVNIIRQESLKNNKNENTAILSAIKNDGSTKEDYLTPAIGIISDDENSEDPRARVRKEVKFADVGKLNDVAIRQADQQYNYFSNLPAGINTIIDMLEDDKAVQRKGNKFTISVPGIDGKLATTTKGVRNMNTGEKLNQTTELEIDFPEYDENSPNDELFKGDFSDQLKEYFKFKSFAANGAYSYKDEGPEEKYDRIELEKPSGPNQFAPLINDINSIKGTTLSSENVITIVNNRTPDGYNALNIDQAIKYYRDNEEIGSAEKLEEIKKSGKNPVFVQQTIGGSDDSPMYKLKGTDSGRVSKEQLEAEVTNFFKDGGEQKDFRTGSIAAKSSTKQLDKDIAYYERIIKNPNYEITENQERILKELKAEKNSRK